MNQHEAASQPTFADIARGVLDENARVLGAIDPAAVDGLVRLVAAAPRVFVAGEGRSGLVARMFAMRLMHLGRVVFVVGETVTPAVRAGDLLVAASGSGETRFVCEVAEAAKTSGVAVAAVTTDPASRLAKTATLAVVVPAAAKLDRSGERSRQFAGSLFEQATLLFFDAAFWLLSAGQAADALWARHANLE